MISLFLLHDTGPRFKNPPANRLAPDFQPFAPSIHCIKVCSICNILYAHYNVFTMYRIYNRQRKQEKTERALPLSHKHFIPPLYTYVYRKDQVSPVPGLFVLLKYHLEQKHHKRHRHNRKQCSHNIDSAGILGVVSIYLAHLGDR